MTDIDSLLQANRDYAAAGPPRADRTPSRSLAVITCIDTRIDPLAVLGLRVGDAVILRNAGGRVTDDVLRSLAVAVHLLGVRTVVLMQHTLCGVVGTTDAELRAQVGADLDFLPIAEHTSALRSDIAALTGAPYLSDVTSIAGFVYDVESGAVTEIERR